MVFADQAVFKNTHKRQTVGCKSTQHLLPGENQSSHYRERRRILGRISAAWLFPPRYREHLPCLSSSQAVSLQSRSLSMDAAEPWNTQGHQKPGSASDQKRSDLTGVPNRGNSGVLSASFHPLPCQHAPLSTSLYAHNFPFLELFVVANVVSLYYLLKIRDGIIVSYPEQDYCLFHCSNGCYSFFFKEKKKWPQPIQCINFDFLIPVALKKIIWR